MTRANFLVLPKPEAVRRERPGEQMLADAAAAAVAMALADPTRLLGAVALREGGELCVGDLDGFPHESDMQIFV